MVSEGCTVGLQASENCDYGIIFFHVFSIIRAS